jgi:hypothetical protein
VDRHTDSADLPTTGDHEVKRRLELEAIEPMEGCSGRTERPARFADVDHQPEQFGSTRRIGSGEPECVRPDLLEPALAHARPEAIVG